MNQEKHNEEQRHHTTLFTKYLRLSRGKILNNEVEIPAILRGISHYNKRSRWRILKKVPSFSYIDNRAATSPRPVAHGVNKLITCIKATVVSFLRIKKSL